MIKALLFDCDGVLVDTERDGHRIAFNRAFVAQGLNVEWSTEVYGELLAIAGGKERMHHYFEQAGWPPDIDDRDTFIKGLHKAKTNLFMQIIEDGQLPLRAGVARLVDEAIAAGLTLAVCSTSNERAVTLIVERLLGAERRARFAGIFAGDIVSRKKPDPEIYDLARTELGLAAGECLVVEDSRNGLLAARSAGMPCIVTISSYTGSEDFTEADAVYRELGDPPGTHVTLAQLMEAIGHDRS